MAWHVVVAAVVSGLATFVVVRAIQVPLTYDEAAAYLRYIASDPLSLFDFSVATNHLLNTLLTKLFSAAAGSSEAALRLPSLVGYALYVCFSLLILRRLTHRAIAVAGFLLLNLNPYVLDYFALSRGYGLSLGLLAGALFFLLDRRLSPSLALAGAAVMANFSLLNVYPALWLAGLVLAVISSRPVPDSTRPALAQRSYARHRGSTLWSPAVLAVYTALIWSQDFGLSEKLYEPVTVRLLGPNESALDGVRVYRLDHRGRTEPLSRDGHVWDLGRPAHFCGVRIEAPVAAADALGGIELIAGRHAFLDRQGATGLWRRSDAGNVRTLESTGAVSLPKSRVPAFRCVMNWSGDRTYLARLAGRTAVVLTMLAVLALALRTAGALATRSGVLSPGAWTPLSASALWTAALAGLPLYLLKRNGELYYGGERGLIQDTFHSLIDGSFYGQIYFANQTDLVFAAVLATVVVFAAACALGYRRGWWPRMLPGAMLLAIMAIVSTVVLVQRLIFGTPHLLGRTALFFIPLYVLFLAFAADAIAAFGRPWRFAATIVLATAVSLSVYHVGRTANVTHTLDWPRDAATRMMMADVVALAAPTPPQGSPVSLGVEWPFYPVAEFYARRAGIPIDVHVLPRRDGTDFLYLEDAHHDASVKILRRYSLARSVLAQPAR